MYIRSSTATIAAFVVAGMALISCDKHQTTTPQPPVGPTTPTPSPTVQVVRVELSAPESLPPGTSAQLTVNAVKSDGTLENVTSQTQWSSTDIRVVTVDASGVARAIALGEVTISARYQNRSAGTSLLVVPAGTYRLKGRITDAGLGLPGVTVTVVRGTGEGLTTTTDVNGAYALYGVRDHIVLQAKRDGYLNGIQELDVTQSRVYDFGMQLDGDRINLRGRYALTLTRMPCTGDVPVSRTYDATLEQNDRRLSVTLSGADFIVARGHGNTFTGSLDGTRVQFSLSSASVYYYYYYYGQYDLIERLDTNHAFIVSGNVTAGATAQSITGTLNGVFSVALGNAPPFLRFQGRCVGASHRFEMARR